MTTTRLVLRLLLIAASLVSSVYAQEAPSGTAARAGREREMGLRQLSRAALTNRVPVTWTACGTAKVDGILSPGEWDRASTQVITVNTAAGAVPATLYIMNDNLTLYFALQFPEAARNYGSLGIEFDKDNDGVPYEAGDDAIVFNNQLGFFDDFRQPCGPSICAPGDITDGGSTEGRGAYVNDGTNSVYELSHPFQDFDAGHDLTICGLGNGKPACPSVGFFLLLRQIDSSGALHDTYYPDVAVYDQITYQACAIPVLTGCGTSTIDGGIGSSEWAGAGKYRLSVNITPNGDTTPGTFYVMNDSFNVYTALAFDQPALSPANSLEIFFDNVAATWIGDDSLIFGGGLTDLVGVACFPPPFGTPPCRSGDTGVGGTTDGAGALANNGSQTAFEISHPLNSGDPNDFALSYGDTVPYRLDFFAGSAQTLVPDVLSGQMLATWLICTPGATQNVRDLSQSVGALEKSGALSEKNADTLSKDLIKANGNLQTGKSKQAANDLGDFVKDVTKMMRKGELADRFGRPLVAAANSAMSQL